MSAVPERIRTLGKTPTMAFVLDYLREFPGAEYSLVRKAALSHGLPAPASVMYGNALRVLRKEQAAPVDPVATPTRVGRRGRRPRRPAGRGVQDLAGLVQQMESVIADRDWLRDAADRIQAVIRQARR
jgi:hypothetical protein